MRWTMKKSSPWDKFNTWKAKYKKFEIDVNEGAEGFSRNIEYYWFSLRNDETDTRHNSLWSEGKYKTLELAQQEAIKWIDDYLKSQRIK
ncbi:hypothetical protein NBRC13296_12535 [Paenibacillus chitinolyticus]|uniref:hypothetical protein n=1 Tax=Paenibacillus chitinolyticus TaxID=79263 RepID=UPI00355900C7